MRILFICKDNPFGVGGGSYATHAYLRAFSDLSKGDIDVFMASYIKEDPSIPVAHYYRVEPRTLIKRALSLFSGNLHRNVPAVRKHLRQDAHYDLVVFNNSRVTSGLIRQVKDLGIPVATIHHNMETEFFVDNTPNPFIRHLFTGRIRSAERNAYRLSDFNLFLTKRDEERFNEYYGKSQGKSFCIGVFEFKDIPRLPLKESVNDPLIVAITGSLCTVQGIDGVMFFLKELLPCLPKEMRVIISGRSPAKEIYEACKYCDNVEIIPNPSDMERVISKADIYLCPTRLGGGLKLRIMDGLRMGTPVISHVRSARGYEQFVEIGCMAVFNDANDFQEALNYIVEGILTKRVTRSFVRERYDKLFSYEAGYARLKEIFSALSRS